MAMYAMHAYEMCTDVASPLHLLECAWQATPCRMQAHARGGEWPRLYSAIAHVDIELGYIGRALYWVRYFTPKFTVLHL